MSLYAWYETHEIQFISDLHKIRTSLKALFGQILQHFIKWEGGKGMHEYFHS